MEHINTTMRLELPKVTFDLDVLSLDGCIRTKRKAKVLQESLPEIQI